MAIAFFGDGASNHAAFHESLNFAGVRKAPVVFVCENNLYATATAIKDVTLNPEIWQRAKGYGIPASRSTATMCSRCGRPPALPSSGRGRAAARR